MAAPVVRSGRLVRPLTARLGVLLTAMALLGMLLPLWPRPASAAPTLGAPADQSTDFPIFDTHLHYSQDAWGLFSPQDIISLMDQAGVYRALLSSTPDDGTLQLFQFAPGRIVPVLRPYRRRR